MAIQTRDLTLKEYLRALSAEIPDYQRGYAWGNDQISQFLEDLVEEYSSNSEKKEKNYFFWTIVVAKEEHKKAQVIDGQQRLTTITIFLAAVRNYLNSIRETAGEDANELCEEINHDYIGRESSRNGSTYKLQQRGEIGGYFRDEIQKPKLVFEKLPLTRKEGRKPPRNAIAQAYNMIVDWLTNDLNAVQYDETPIYPNDNAKAQRVANLTDTLLNNFFVVEIESNDLTTGYQIFQNLNGTGKDLNPGDLIKTDFFGKVSGAETNAIAEKWDEIQSVIENDDTTEIIRYYWNATNMKFATKRSLYPKVSKEVKSAGDVFDFLDGIKKVAPAYMAATGADSDLLEYRDEHVQNALHDLRSLNLKSYLPILFALELMDATNEQMATVLNAIVALMFRNVIIANEVANKYEKSFAQLAVSLQDDDSIVKALEDLAAAKIPDEDFKEALLKFNAEGSLEIARFILRKFEHLDDLTKTVNGNKDVHIEHIMPQKPENIETWGFSSTEDATFNEHLWALGNLVLLDSKKNTSIKNHNFEQKKEQYRLSGLKQAKDLCEYSEWNAHTIDQRTEEIAERAVTIC
ncbi:hypothetical protein JOC36_000256 [Weissella uvarum]|uniref:DUF262 domain-containing protein n=1 Tax=Weissella uvarum TaxID=1479233 RepID=UPI001960A225|nr:DUF262 domain-containing protein [Weissella uvarum]MBM7616723.1 hypothetical protein [Weissella uvarum]MCM0594822.1 DUF262 domain-containing protein [Weissella uvarum]